MTATELEQVRLSLLRFLSLNRTPYGLPARALLQFLRAEGTRLEQPAVEAEMQYLVDKGLAVEVSKTLSPEIRVWRITAAGRDQVAALET